MSKNELIEKAVIDWQGEFKPECDFVYGYSGAKSYAACAEHILGDRPCLFTKREFNAAADRMRSKPDWSTLPAKAEWLAQDRCGIWKPMQGRKPTIEEGSYWVTDHHLQPQLRGTVIGDWRNTLEKRPVSEIPESKQLKPSVSKSLESKWFEAGELPPIGAVCEYKFQNPKYSWQPVTVNYISNIHAILTCHLDDDEVHTDGYTVADFRPIKTDKEKAIESAQQAIKSAHLTAWNEPLQVLYDAGLLRLPDQK